MKYTALFLVFFAISKNTIGQTDFSDSLSVIGFERVCDRVPGGYFFIIQYGTKDRAFFIEKDLSPDDAIELCFPGLEDEKQIFLTKSVPVRFTKKERRAFYVLYGVVMPRYTICILANCHGRRGLYFFSKKYELLFWTPPKKKPVHIVQVSLII